MAGNFGGNLWRDRCAALPALEILSPLVVEALTTLILCPILLAVAIGNRFPIIFYDTGAYVLQGLGGVFMEERSPVYSLLLRDTGAGTTLWLVAGLQALLTSFVIVQIARTVSPRMPLPLLALIAIALDIVTALPWYVGQIQPDCFTAIVVLCAYLLSFHVLALGIVRAGAILVIAALAIAVHPSHLVLAAGLLLIVITYKAAVYWTAAPWPVANVRYIAIALALGTLTIAGANYHYTHKIFLTRAGPDFLFARILQDGIVVHLLDDTCPHSGYALCQYKDVLPRTADLWLWGEDSPFQKMHRFSGTTGEAQRILWASVERYPWAQLSDALADGARQFAMFSTGDQIEPQQWVLYPAMDRLIPQQMPAYLAARQQRGGFDFKALNLVHVPFGWLSIAGSAFALGYAFHVGARREAALIGFVLFALAGNALVCGALSNPHDRYQSRLIWIMPFSLALLAANRGVALRAGEESGT